MKSFRRAKNNANDGVTNNYGPVADKEKSILTMLLVARRKSLHHVDESLPGISFKKIFLNFTVRV